MKRSFFFKILLGFLLQVGRETDPAAMENHRTRPEIQAVLMGRMGTDVHLSSTLRDKILYVAIPIRSRAKEGCV